MPLPQKGSQTQSFCLGSEQTGQSLESVSEMLKLKDRTKEFNVLSQTSSALAALPCRPFKQNRPH